jgi:ABC-2 type transport system permease protein
MSTVLESPSSAVTVPTLPAAEAAKVKVTQWRVIRSEFLKMRTLRSTWLTLAVAMVALPGIGFAIAWSTKDEWNQRGERRHHHFNPLADPLSGFFLSQLAIGVLGVLLMAGEYPGGMIRATLGAVPKRLPVLWAKLAIFTTLTAVTMIPLSIITFFMSQKILAGLPGAHIGWSAPTVARTVIGVGLYLTVAAALAIGVGAIIRNVAGGIGAFVGIMLVLPLIATALPELWANRINKWLPSNAGQAIMSFGSDSTVLSPWRGFAVFVGYAVAAIIAAAVLLRRRDA